MSIYFADRSEDSLQFLPVYIVCDESSSMSEASIQEVNVGIVEVFDEINADPIIDAKARVGIVAFSDTARVLFPLTQLSDVTQIPYVVAGSGEANFGNLFRLLTFVVRRDIREMKAQGFGIGVPLILLMTAGHPTDDGWQRAKDKFLSSVGQARARLVGYGVSGADKSVLAEISHWGSRTGTKYFFMAEDAGSPGAAIKEIVKFLIAS